MSAQEERVRRLQHDLRLLAATDDRYLVPPQSGVYDEGTALSVRAYQFVNGLPVTGRLDATTAECIADEYDQLAELFSEPRPVFAFSAFSQMNIGDDTRGVALLQALLWELGKPFEGLSDITLTGIYDTATAALVSQWQSLCGVEPDGILTRPFWDRLTDLYHAGL